MFESVILKLLQGEFICGVSHPDEFRFLSEEGNQEEVSRYCAKIRRGLTKTPHESGFYLAYADVAEGDRQAIKAHFQDIKSGLGPVAMFFQLVMRATGQEDLMMHGAIIESAAVMATIDQDVALRAELQNLALYSKTTATEGSQRALFEKLINKMKGEGYLVLSNSERGLYQVTSKMEYLLDVIRFLQENDPVLAKSAEPEEEPETGQLL